MKNKTLFRLVSALLALVLLCAASAALADTVVTLDDDVDYDAGYTRISWKVEGDDLSKYKVYVEATDNGPSPQTKFLGGTAKNSKHYVKVTNMIPGKSYTVYVTDNDGNILAKRDYDMPEPEIFEDGKLKDTSIKISLEPRRLKKGDQAKNAKKIDGFSAKEITKAVEKDNYLYGVKYSMKMPQLGHERTFFLTLAFESPDGYLMVVSADDITYEYVARGYQTIWFYILGTDFFPEMYKCTEEIPKGKYKTYMFLDGMLVNKSKFNVK